MTILPYLVIIGLVGLLFYRYLWLWRMTKYWEEMVACYIVQSGTAVDKVASLLPTLPSWQMILSIWTWRYPAFIINQEGYQTMLDFFYKPAKVADTEIDS